MNVAQALESDWIRCRDKIAIGPGDRIAVGVGSRSLGAVKTSWFKVAVMAGGNSLAWYINIFFTNLAT